MSTNPPQSPDVARAAFEISLRPPTWDDVPLMFEIGSDPVACAMAGVKQRTREAFMSRWKEIFADPAINTRVIEMSTPDAGGAAGGRVFVGSISVFQVPGDAGRDHIGYWLAREHWGKGIASRAVAVFLLEEPRRPLHATAAMTNLASHRVLLRNGFRLVGTRMGEETDRYMAREIGDFVLEAGGGKPAR